MAIAKTMETYLVQSSWIRRMFEEGMKLKQQYGADKVFDFSLGNPNLPPPDDFRTVLRETVRGEDAGVHGYMPNAGFEETRRAVASFLEASQGAAVTADRIVMACGAAGALNVAFKALLDPGDEVIIPTPFFAEYRFYVENVGGVPRFVPTRPDFSLDCYAIEQSITERTKAVLLNSPNNPTGRVYDAESIGALAAILEEKSGEGTPLYLIADEPYRDIVYDGREVPSILTAYRNSLLATSYSKSLSIAGERIGFLAVNPAASGCDELMAALSLATRILGFVNAPALMQRVIARLQGSQVPVDEYRRKRDLLCGELERIGYEVNRPDGAFYLFLKSPVGDEIPFVQALKERNILVVPGSGFAGPGYIRIAYCVADETIVNAMKGFRDVFEAFRNQG